MWHESIEIFHKFHQLPKEAEEFYLSIFEPFKSDKILKDKDGVEYQEIANLYGTTIYVKKDKVVKTHGITFLNFELIDKDATSSAKAGIFEDMEAFKDPNSTETQQKKEKLNKLFADILKKIRVDKDKSGGLEAGELAGLSLTKPKRDELSHFIVEHKSEWSTDNKERKKVMLLQKKLADKMEDRDAKTTAQDEVKMTDERIETLGFWGASNPDLTFIHPIALVEGFVGGGALITKEMLNAICPGSGNNQELLDALNKYCPQYEINTPIRIAHFLSQCAQEGSCYGKSTYVEGTNFGLSNALATWPNRASSIRGIPMNGRYLKQPDLFNCVYGSRNGNDSGTNDGYNFRGRGLIQITGRTNYSSFTTYHNNNNPNDIKDFENNAIHREFISTNIEYAVESACWYWRYKGNVYSNINTLADMGKSEDIVHAIGASINGWYAKSREKSGYVWNNTLGIWLKHAVHHHERLAKFNILKNHLGL